MDPRTRTEALFDGVLKLQERIMQKRVFVK